MHSPVNETWTALMRAIDRDDGPAVAAIPGLAAALGAHDPADENARTPLMLAYWRGKAAAAAAIVNAGADCQQEDAKGRHATWYARRFGAGELERTLTDVIDAGVRRISMESVIDGGKASEEKPPERRRTDL